MSQQREPQCSPKGGGSLLGAAITCDALYNVQDDAPFPRFDMVSIPIDIPSGEELLSVDVQSGVCATLDTSGTVIVREVESDVVVLREHVLNPHKLFLHPSATHLIVFCADGEAHYFATQDRRARVSVRLQPGAPAAAGASAVPESTGLFARSFRATSASPPRGGSLMVAATATAKTTSGIYVGESVAWLPDTLCSSPADRGTGVAECVHCLVGCAHGGAILVLEIAVGASGKSPSVRCGSFPSPPTLIPALPIASVVLEPLPGSQGKGCLCMVANASQLLRVTFEATHPSAPVTTTPAGSISTSMVARFMSAIESGAAEWEVKEYPYIADTVSSSSRRSTAPPCGHIALFRPSQSQPVHAYAWTNSVGVLHGVLPRSPTTATDSRDGDVFGCEHFISFANLTCEGGNNRGTSVSGRHASPPSTAVSAAAPPLFPITPPTLVVPTAFHLVMVFPHRCIVLNQPPGLCWETKATHRSGSAVSGYAERRHADGGTSLTDVLSRVRFDPFRNARHVVNLLGAGRDVHEGKLYVYGDRQLWVLFVEGEHRRQWRLFLERAMDADRHSLVTRKRLFRAAHQLSQTQPAAHSLVQFLRGQFYLDSCSDSEAATSVFATCDWFDEVYAVMRVATHLVRTQALTESPQKSVMASFLAKRFSRLARIYERAHSSMLESAAPSPSSATATSLATRADSLMPQLASLLAFAVVEELDVVTQEAYPSTGASVQSVSSAQRQPDSGGGGGLESCLQRAAAEAPCLFAQPGFAPLLIHLLEEQGRQDCALRVAPLTGQHAYVVAYHVAMGQFASAIEVLAKYSAGRPEMAAVWYAHASVLIVERPVALVTAMLRTMFKDEQAGRPQLLDLERLLPALARYDTTHNEAEDNDENQVVVLLEQGLTRFQCVSTAVHTFYLSVLAASHDAERLEEFITGSLFYDHNFALRECLRHGNAQACILLYKQLRLYEDAVRMALKQSAPPPIGSSDDDATTGPSATWPGLSQAEDILRGIGDKVSEETVKRLWLMTAEYAMQRQGVRATLAVVEDSGGVLHLDDILGRIADDTVVQDLKGVLMARLDGYTDEGAALRRRQEEAFQTAEAVKVELGRLRHQYGYVAGHQRCLLCSRPLLQGTQPYVLYPSCQHVVHESCAVARLEEMGGLEAFFTDEGIAPYVLDGVCSLEELVHVDCVVCGEAAIVELDIPLCEEDASWAI